jgi:histidinol dehydrogenase
MRILQGENAEKYIRVLERRGSRLDKVEAPVRRIVEDVRRCGDRALKKYAQEFDGLKPKQALRVPEEELAQASEKVSPEFKSALCTAEQNIRRLCEWQKPQSWTRSRSGISVGQTVRPLGSVGCYVPGGRFPLVSTLLMTVIPAQVGGVENIRVVSPHPCTEVLAAAAMLGVREFYRVGGAQAIAALAYGTEAIPRVDKIVGPGNLYVTAAKKLVAFDCAIDMLAGPTEVVIVSNDGNPEFIAADLLAQSEHDPETMAVFITESRELALAVKEKVNSGTHGRLSASTNGTRTPFKTRMTSLIAKSRQQGFEWANRIAPEHMTVAKADLPLVQNAGSIFIGDYSAQAAGDYASGPNHVLPTGGAARFRGGLSVMDFVKVITVQELSSQGLSRLAPAVVRLATTEGLYAHAASIAVRCASA